jgi:DNA polymerase-3 subunit alpha
MGRLEDTGFVHLHVHSAFSLLEGALTIAKLQKLALADRMPALALTDTNNLFGALEFSEKMAEAGIQPIVGIQMSVDFQDRKGGFGRPDAAREGRGNLVLLAATEEGYANLMALSSAAFMDVPTGEQPHLLIERLGRFAPGLIALTGGASGPIDRAIAMGVHDLAEARLSTLRRLFGDRLYVELQRHGRPESRVAEADLLDLAYGLRLPLVAANETFFGKPDEHEAHDALLAVAEGRLVSDDTRRQVTPDHAFKSRKEMVQLFRDLPEAAANTVEIALRCAVRARKRKPILPRFARDGDEDAELRRQASEGLRARLAAHGPAAGLSVADYEARLDFEIGIISRMAYAGYFLIVADFIKWAKGEGIPVGPGRGSGAGSLVAYCLTITDLDPLRFGLLFERFLNPDRVSMPDFDIDFCQERRDEVIRYVQRRYGADRVAQIITFGTLLARGVMRDVGRVLEMPYGQVDRLTKLVPQNPANPVTLERAVADEPRLREAARDEPVVERMLNIAMRLEGLYRHASTHAAGIVIGDRPLVELVPLYRDPKSDMPVTQFNMKWVEPAGLVKFDFLGLKTLSVIARAVELIAERGITVEIGAIPLDDRKTFELLGRGDVVGVFQVESAGMRRALVDMRADRFEDLIALVALYRPGPMANIPVYCARKLGRESIEYLHPALEPILKETFGVITYQEQVQQIARDLAGYTLAEADLLRRAMGKKIKSEMDAQRERFMRGAAERGIDQGVATAIFDACAKFAEYGFNKSHSAPYALITYQTAYLKANYPVEFLAASMAFDMTNTDKLVEFRADALRRDIVVEAPCVNMSDVSFRSRDGRIAYALAAIKGVGVEAARAIVNARGDRPFESLGDLANRIEGRHLSRRTIEILAEAGAFDTLSSSREAVVAGADRITAMTAAREAARTGGQASLFASEPENSVVLPQVTRWTQAERLKREHASLGFFASGHPLDDYADALARMGVGDHASFMRRAKARNGAQARLAGVVVDRQERRMRSGAKFGVVTLSDRGGQFEVLLFAEILAQFRDVLEPGRLIVLSVMALVDGEEVRLRVNGAEALDAAVARGQKGLRLFLRDASAAPVIAEQLRRGGDGQVTVMVMLDGGDEVEVGLPARYDAGPGVMAALKAIAGVTTVQSM